MRRNARKPYAVIAALLASTLILATPRPAAAIKAVEGLTSTIFQPDQSSFSGIGLRMRVQIPQLVEGFSVVPTIEYWRNQSTLGEFNLKATRKDAMLGALIRYDMKREGWKPYFGAGIGMHFLEDALDAPSLGVNDRSETLLKGGLALLGGVKFGLQGKLGNLVELEYHYLPHQSQLKFNWGLSYDF